MVENKQSLFWESMPGSLRNAVEQTVPADVLEKLYLSTKSKTLERKYEQLEHLLQDLVNQQNQIKQPSTADQAIPSQTTNNPHLSASFALAILQMETKQYTEAEETYREILAANPSSSRPDLAATSNLIDVLNVQHKYAEAQTTAMQVLPLLQNELGANSPQYLGCTRKLMESLVGQDKGEEARKMYQRGMDLAATIRDDQVKKEEIDAMQEMGRKIDLLE
ncbi:hypothetical protein QM012_004102 [Aureobasidium pullulans]|uniref:TPR-like protein n=1 Tax=Aureobasidium pullulans TaxID=5580 RepID=A0ABR0T794_AURPU